LVVALRAGGRAGNKRRPESAEGGHPSDFSDENTTLFSSLLVVAAPEWAPAQAEPVAPDAVIPAGRDGRRPARAFALTETGGAELLADRLAGEIAFVPEWGKWLTWEGTHWRADAAEVVMMERTKLVAHELLGEAQWALKNDDVRAKAFAQFAASAQRRQFRRAVLDLAKSEPGIALPFSQFDCDHYLLNCSNGPSTGL
jgi:phage/plasmid-associated DNA primase